MFLSVHLQTTASDTEVDDILLCFSSFLKCIEGVNSKVLFLLTILYHCNKLIASSHLTRTNTAVKNMENSYSCFTLWLDSCILGGSYFYLLDKPVCHFPQWLSIFIPQLMGKSSPFFVSTHCLVSFDFFFTIPFCKYQLITSFRYWLAFLWLFLILDNRNLYMFIWNMYLQVPFPFFFEPGFFFFFFFPLSFPWVIVCICYFHISETKSS